MEMRDREMEEIDMMLWRGRDGNVERWRDGEMKASVGRRRKASRRID
jgi:hypothetical protein